MGMLKAMACLAGADLCGGVEELTGGETVVACGLVVEQRTPHPIIGEPMKFLTLADWTGLVETELFAQTYKRCA
jgi:hypothetical protein